MGGLLWVGFGWSWFWVVLVGCSASFLGCSFLGLLVRVFWVGLLCSWVVVLFLCGDRVWWWLVFWWLAAGFFLGFAWLFFWCVLWVGVLFWWGSWLGGVVAPGRSPETPDKMPRRVSEYEQGLKDVHLLIFLPVLPLLLFLAFLFALIYFLFIYIWFIWWLVLLRVDMLG